MWGAASVFAEASAVVETMADRTARRGGLRLLEKLTVCGARPGRRHGIVDFSSVYEGEAGF